MREEWEKYRFKGYLPRYCMVFNDMILQNPTTKEHVIFILGNWVMVFEIKALIFIRTVMAPLN